MELTTPYADVLPPLSTEERDSLRLSIEAEGVREPVLATEDGRLVDGHHRYGITRDVRVAVVPGSAGWSDAQCRAHAIKANLDRRNLSPDQRRAVRDEQRRIAARLRSDGWAQAQVAALLGLARQTVAAWEDATNANNSNGCVPDCRVKIPGSEYQRIADRVSAGEPVAQVAADYKVTPFGLRKALKKHEARTQQDAMANTTAAEQYQGTCTSEDLRTLVDAGKRFGTVYLDPPWRYDNQGTRAATNDHYGTMSLDDIAALPVGELAAPDSHLHLWTTNGFIFECPRLLEAWGFTFKSMFVWCKPQMGIGNYWRVSHEILLTAVRGDARGFAAHNLKSYAEFDRGEHSAKPEQVRVMIEKASPGPYLELFGRRPAPGWTVWGNQIERNLFNQS